MLKISIITPTLNSIKYIKATIDSINSQSYKFYELIIVDGGSIDGTTDVVKEYEMIKVITGKDGGQSEAINKGFRISDGQILAWQNSDDIYFEDTFMKVANFFEDHPDIDIVYGNYSLIDENGNWICNVKPPEFSIWKLKHWRFVPMQPTTFWRRKVYEKIGNLKTDLHFTMDLDFFARAAKNNFKFARIDEFLGAFRVHNQSKTQNRKNKTAIKKEILDVLRSNFSFNPLNEIIFLFYYLRSQVSSYIKRNWIRK